MELRGRLRIRFGIKVEEGTVSLLCRRVCLGMNVSNEVEYLEACPE